MSNGNQITQTVRNMVGWGRTVIASVDAHHEPVSTALDGQSNLSAAEWDKWLRGLRNALAHATDDLLTKAGVLARERGDDIALREARDQAQGKAFGEVVRTRGLLDAIDSSQSRRYGLEGSTPETADDLVIFGNNAIAGLRGADETLEGMGVSVQTGVLADELEPAIAELASRIEDLRREEKEADAALVARDRAIAHWRKTYRSVANMLVGAFEMAGENELAERVRPTVRRTAGVENPPAADEPVDNPEPVEA
ncbi:hypothetical protein FIV42_28995 [Persicimonas caeni]|uniref:Uncharacterized protein n=1 Tax=Persicimonas caeni TaxID=2292766 RepID=A0A4Y6Q398_PERCE|nr:hypothetical protein [Persicimonas caeni]QDG54637.1 hypothetical protein FIV42_28995 [Persicimonas caeni]QED35858.1 hypothetical protein FRD00_28990 [Persicimonas caeni]